MIDTTLRKDILLVFQVATLGMIPPNLRGITIGWENKRIHALFFFDQTFGSDEQEIISEIEAEIMANFPGLKVCLDGKRVDFPENLNPYTLNAWIYRRKEHFEA